MAKVVFTGSGASTDVQAAANAAAASLSDGDTLELVGEIGLSRPIVVENKDNITVVGRNGARLHALNAASWSYGKFSEWVYPTHLLWIKGCTDSLIADIRLNGNGYRGSCFGMGPSSTIQSARNTVQGLYVVNNMATNRDIESDPENAVCAIGTGGGTDHVFRWNTIEDVGLVGDPIRRIRGFWLGSRIYQSIFTLSYSNTVTSGTWTITMNGLTTQAISYAADAATVKSALDFTFGPNTFTVTGGPMTSTPMVIKSNRDAGAYRNVKITVSTNSTLLVGGVINLVDTSAAFELENNLICRQNTVRRSGYTAFAQFSHVALFEENLTRDCGGTGLITPTTDAVRCEDVTARGNWWINQDDNGYQGDPGSLTDLRNLRTQLLNNYAINCGINGFWIQGCDTTTVKGNYAINNGRDTPTASIPDGAGFLVTNSTTITMTDNHAINERGNYQNNGVCISASAAYGNTATVTIDGGEYVGSEQTPPGGSFSSRTAYRENGIGILRSGAATLTGVTIKRVTCRDNNRCGVYTKSGDANYVDATDGGNNRYFRNRGVGSEISVDWLQQNT